MKKVVKYLDITKLSIIFETIKSFPSSSPRQCLLSNIIFNRTEDKKLQILSIINTVCFAIEPFGTKNEGN
jgi:hypothetical protein